MAGKKTAVFGIYSTLSSADHATDTLIRSGFAPSDISALLPENLGSRQIGTTKATKAPEGAATGAGSGRFSPPRRKRSPIGAGPRFDSLRCRTGSTTC